MDTKNLLRKSGPYILAIVLFMVISVIYFSPVLEGKKLQSSDGAQFKGMSKEIVDFREQAGTEPLWTNSMFGGMPAYQISVVYHHNVAKNINNIMKLIYKNWNEDSYFEYIKKFSLPHTKIFKNFSNCR